MSENDKAYIFDSIMRLSIWEQLKVEESMRWGIVLSIWTEASQLEKKARSKKWESEHKANAPMAQPMAQPNLENTCDQSKSIQTNPNQPNPIQNKTIENISKDIWEQALVVTNEIIKEEHGDPEINNILETIKEQVEFLWFIYKKWSHEKERAQNILTGKEFWDICEKSNLSRVEFCKSIIVISSKLDFWNGKIYNAETLYKNYAMVYNTAMSKKYWPKSESALDIIL